MTSRQIESVENLTALLDAAQKTVNIDIDPDTLEDLKNNEYKLCFAKKVASTYNVVWQSYDSYLVSNQFQWTPQYQLFGSNTFQDGLTVRVSTNLVNIGLNQVSVLDSSGVLLPPASGGLVTAITMNNKYGLIHPGLNQLSTGIDGQAISTSIYVAPDAVEPGDIQLTPEDVVLVWFEQDIETSTMFSVAQTNAVEIDLTDSNSETRLYKNGVWSTP